MAVGEAVFRLTDVRRRRSEQTADIVRFIQLDATEHYSQMLTLCGSNKHVKDFWRVLLELGSGWNVIEDDAKVSMLKLERCRRCCLLPHKQLCKCVCGYHLLLLPTI
jgi:hypothetical protein